MNKACQGSVQRVLSGICVRIFFVLDSASLFFDEKDWLRLTVHPLIRDGGELMPTYIYKGCIVKENRDGLLQNV